MWVKLFMMLTLAFWELLYVLAFTYGSHYRVIFLAAQWSSLWYCMDTPLISLLQGSCFLC
jgi:hypothetical protein